MDDVWEPFQRAGMPLERWSEIEQSIEQLRPLATEALVAIFGQRMSAQIEAAFGELTRGLSEAARRREPGGSGTGRGDSAGSVDPR